MGVVRHYTKEAGVRSLEREIAAVCRKVAVEVVKKDRNSHIQVGTKSLHKFLGPIKFRYGKADAETEDRSDYRIGLDRNGWRILSTEVTVMPGKGQLIITGKLGDVMQESAQAAMSYVRSRATDLGLDKDFYQKLDIHFTYPKGRFPKMVLPLVSRWLPPWFPR